MSRKFVSFLILMIALLLFSVTVSADVSQGTQDCSPINKWDFCVTGVEIQNPETFSGQSQVIDVNVQNVGEKTGTILVILSIRSPQGASHISKSQTVRDISPGETKQATFLVKLPDDTVEGEYEVSAIVMTPTSTHTFDSSGYSNTFLVERPTIMDRISMNIGVISAIITILSGVVGATRWGLKNNRLPTSVRSNDE